MKIILKIFKWLFIFILTVLICGILYIRFTRYTDKLIYQINGIEYDKFETVLNHTTLYFERENNVRLHGVLFKPDSAKNIGTIIHYPGKGMHLNSVQNLYKPLLEKGFQIFSFERRGFGLSNGVSENSLTLKQDALFVFDELMKIETVKSKPIIIWGQSLGGAFAAMNAKERENKINGLILEGTFNSFVDIGKFYARVINLENFKWLMPILMNNDYPAEKQIEELKIPIVVIHSEEDNEVPFELGAKLSEGNKEAKFWKLKGRHINGIFDYETEYINEFLNFIDEK